MPLTGFSDNLSLYCDSKGVGGAYHVQQYSLGGSILIGMMGEEIQEDWGGEDRNKGEIFFFLVKAEALCFLCIKFCCPVQRVFCHDNKDYSILYVFTVYMS